MVIALSGCPRSAITVCGCQRLSEPDLTLRARAAGLLVAGHGAVAGYAAAELWGASCAPPDEPVHALMTHRYRCDGLRVHRDYFDFVETVPISSGGAVTIPERTAYDLARWAPRLTERVVAVDALTHNCGVDLDAIRALRHRYLGCHGGADITDALRLSDRRSESPMESRVRMVLVLDGLPPEVQYPVVLRGRRYRLDLAYPRQRVAVEYNGEEHRSQRRASACACGSGPLALARPAAPAVIALSGRSRRTIPGCGRWRLLAQPSTPTTSDRPPP